MHKSRRRGARLVALAAVGALALAACGGDDDTSSADSTPTAGTDAPGPDTSGAVPTTEAGAPSSAPADTTEPGTTAPAAAPAAGGTLTYLISAEVTSMDPATFSAMLATAATHAPRGALLYDGLVTESILTGEVTDRLAESFETSDDGTTWTITMRPDVVFSDGTAFDAEAIKYNWERLGNPDMSSASAAHIAQIASMEVTDPLTLEVTLVSANRQFDRLVARSPLTLIGSPTAMESLGDQFGAQPVGAGPYVLSEWTRDSQAVFTKNPTYAGTTYLDEVVLKPIPDETQRLTTLQTGGGDMMLTGDAFTKFEGSEMPGIGVASVPLNGGNVMFFNNEKPPFDDARARQAIALAVDVDLLSDTVFDGHSTPVHNVLTDTSPLYDATADQTPSDPAQAQALLDELAAEGKPLSFTISTPESFVREAEWLQAVLSGYSNVTVDLAPFAQAEYTPTTRSGNFELLVGTSVFTDPDPGILNFLRTAGSQNYARYSNPDLDALLDAAHAATDDAARRSAWTEALQLIAEEVPMHWLERTEIAVLYNEDRVVGVDALEDLAMIRFGDLSVASS